MNPGLILIVDDEKNIRLSLSMALEKLNIPVETAASGEEAMEKLGQGDYEFMLLDLRLPGMDGMEVLRRVSQQRPEIKVIIITGYGSIDLAVEAMKLGAVDFLQKPFDAAEVRGVVRRLLVKTWGPQGYEYYMAMAKNLVVERDFDVAAVYAQKAVFLDPKPDALNLLGGITEIKGNLQEALDYYRAALSRDPDYVPAQLNLKRTDQKPYTSQGIAWG
jgi:two-component system, OmpR family, alkaline phosphatase synthesis response regulator PhoP